MSDRLNEALEQYARPVSGEPGWYMLPLEVIDVRTAAARAYADLVNGERVEWCETHKRPASNQSVCTAWSEAAGENIGPCRIVSKLLIDPPKEEE